MHTSSLLRQPDRSGEARRRSVSPRAAAARRSGDAMQIEVIGDDSSSAQARTYAEYRVFAVLSRYTETVRCADVLITRAEASGMRDRVACAITVMLHPSGVARARATGDHTYAAINRAAERLRDLMARRRAERRSS